MVAVLLVKDPVRLPPAVEAVFVRVLPDKISGEFTVSKAKDDPENENHYLSTDM